MAQNRISKIKLSSGQTYAIYDANALRLNDKNVLITGDKTVDDLILNGHMSIVEIDDVPVADSIANVLVQDPNTGKIVKRAISNLLKDIGGISYNMHNDTGVLEFKVGL